MPEIIERPPVKPEVSSQGYGDANIFFLGGAPGKTDLLNGIALSGYNESTLNQFLYPHKLNLNQCYRSLFIKEKLPYGGTNPKKQREALKSINYEGYLDLLYDEIKSVSPNVLVPLDAIALAAVFPHINGIHKPKGSKYWTSCYRGSILPIRNDFSERLGRSVRLIPTFSPQYLQVDWAARSYVNLDFKRIKENQNATLPIVEFGICWVAKTARAFQEFLDRQYAKKPKRVTFDIETYAGIPTCVSFCFDGFESCTIPLLDDDISPIERTFLFHLAGKVFADESLEKNNQNIKYDWTILERFLFNIVNVRSDTMLKTSLLYPELPKGLDFLTSIYTDIPYYKDEGKEFNPKLHTRDRLYLYCAKDSLAAHIISEKQDKELEEEGMRQLYENEVAPSLLIYKNIDITGILVDQTQKRKLHEKYTNLFDITLGVLRGLTGKPEFNVNAHAKVGQFIYEELGYPKRTKTNENGTESYETGKEVLDDLLINHAENNKAGKVGAAILARIVLCRKLGKVIEYIETPLHPDGTFRGTSNIGGPETGRSSFSKTIDEIVLPKLRNDKWTRRLGRSLQTITKHGFEVNDEYFDDFESTKIAHDMRSMFVPRRDYVFIEGDGNGAEARVVFVLAEDYEALASMDRKPKIHAKTAALIFKVDVNTIGKDYPIIPKIGIAYYDMGKRIRHAGHYNMGEFRLSQMTHADLDQCKVWLNEFHATNNRISGVFQFQVEQFIKEKRELTNPFGRHRSFFDRLSPKLYKEGLAQIPQSTVSDLTKFTMHRIASDLPGYMQKYRFLTEQHDGILAEVHKDYTAPYLWVFKHHYERKIDFRNGSIPRDFQLVIPAELSMSTNNWMDLEEVHI